MAFAYLSMFRSAGSSPRTWGKCQCQTVDLARDRFIPTYVGQMPDRLGSTEARQAVHPHVRGANVCQATRQSASASVHPHVRGANVRALAVDRIIRRFIPTYVGQMMYSASFCSSASVHPHIRGANDLEDDLPEASYRFIPTYVGQIADFPFDSVHSAVHPHERGANSFAFPLSPVIRGSSPRTWGKFECSWFTPPLARFIPTYVGQMVCCLCFSWPPAVHPHVRGANTKKS